MENDSYKYRDRRATSVFYLFGIRFPEVWFARR
jgi:hypothetical protein